MPRPLIPVQSHHPRRQAIRRHGYFKRLGLVTGKGLGTLIRERFPRWVLLGAVLLVASANTLNIAADLASMGAAFELLVPVPAAAGVVLFAIGIAVTEVMVPSPHHRHARRRAGSPCASTCWTGMLSGVAAMFAIMCTAAVTLGASGSDRSTCSSEQAAQSEVQRVR